VMHGTAKKTSGGLEKKDLAYNKQGRIVSRKKQRTAKKDKRLEKAGYFTQKGKFGCVRKTARRSRRSRRGGQSKWVKSGIKSTPGHKATENSRQNT